MLDGVNAEAVNAVLLEELSRRLQIVVNGRVLLIEVCEVEEREVLDLIAVVPAAAGDVGVVVEVAVGVVGVVADECAVVVERAELSGVVLSGVVGREVYDDLDAVGVRGGD